MIRHALLALLREQSDYGYHLKQRFDERVGHAWQLNVGQVYQTLHALARVGLVRESPGANGPVPHCRRVFEVTPKGSRTLERWLRRRTTQVRPVRDPLLIRMLCLTPPQYRSMAADIDDQERTCQAHLDEVRARHAGAVHSGASPVTLLALAAELMHATSQLEWLAHCRAVLADWPAQPTSPNVSAQ